MKFHAQKVSVKQVKSIDTIIRVNHKKQGLLIRAGGGARNFSTTALLFPQNEAGTTRCWEGGA